MPSNHRLFANLGIIPNKCVMIKNRQNILLSKYIELYWVKLRHLIFFSLEVFSCNTNTRVQMFILLSQVPFRLVFFGNNKHRHGIAFYLFDIWGIFPFEFRFYPRNKKSQRSKLVNWVRRTKYSSSYWGRKQESMSVVQKAKAEVLEIWMFSNYAFAHPVRNL